MIECGRRLAAWTDPRSARETKRPALIDAIGDKMVPGHNLGLGLVQDPVEVMGVGMHVELSVKAGWAMRLGIRQ